MPILKLMTRRDDGKGFLKYFVCLSRSLSEAVRHPKI